MSATMVMLHSMFATGDALAGLQQYFGARGWTCHAPTLRHHEPPAAEQPEALGRVSLRDYAEDLEAEVENLAGGPPVIIGHSMGGQLGMMLAARGLARAVVLLAPTAPWGVVGVAFSNLRTFLPTMARPGFWRRPVRPSFERAAYGILNRVPADERRELYSSFRHESGRAFFEVACWPVDPGRAARVRAGDVSCPVLAVAGGDDRITTPGIVRRTARHYGADYDELSGHGHWLVGEPGWENVAERVERWLQERVGAGLAPGTGSPVLSPST